MNGRCGVIDGDDEVKSITGERAEDAAAGVADAVTVVAGRMEAEDDEEGVPFGIGCRD